MWKTRCLQIFFFLSFNIFLVNFFKKVVLTWNSIIRLWLLEANPSSDEFINFNLKKIEPKNVRDRLFIIEITLNLPEKVMTTIKAAKLFKESDITERREKNELVKWWNTERKNVCVRASKNNIGLFSLAAP